MTTLPFENADIVRLLTLKTGSLNDTMIVVVRGTFVAESVGDVNVSIGGVTSGGGGESIEPESRPITPASGAHSSAAPMRRHLLSDVQV